MKNLALYGQCRAEAVIRLQLPRVAIKSSWFPVFDGAKSFVVHLNKQLAMTANRRLFKDLPTIKVQDNLFTVVHNVDCM